MIVREELFTSVVNLRLGRSVSYFQTIGVTYEVSCLLLLFYYWFWLWLLLLCSEGIPGMPGGVPTLLSQNLRPVM